MNTKLIFLGVLFFLGLLWSGCSPSLPPDKNIIPQDTPCCTNKAADDPMITTALDSVLKDSSLSTDQKSDKLADIGQAAIETPAVALASDDVFDIALKNNPLNAKALYFSALLKPISALKGIVYRFQSLDPIIYQKMMDRIQKLTSKEKKIGEMIGFHLLNQDRPPFQSVSDLQDFIQYEWLPVLEESVEKLSKVEKNTNFSISLYAGRWGFRSKAEIEKSMDLVEAHAAHVTLQGLVVLMKLFVAYNLDEGFNLKKHYDALEKNNTPASPQQMLSDIKGTKMFLSLRKQGGSELQSIAAILKDGIEGLRLVALLLKQARGSNMAIHKVIEQREMNDLSHKLMLASQILSGPIYRNTKDEQNNEVTFMINAMALINNPISDFKSILPTLNASGDDIESVPDSTLSGLLPNGDSLRAFQLIKFNKAKQKNQNWDPMNILVEPNEGSLLSDYSNKILLSIFCRRGDVRYTGVDVKIYYSINQSFVSAQLVGTQSDNSRFYPVRGFKYSDLPMNQRFSLRTMCVFKNGKSFTDPVAHMFTTH